MVKQFTEDELKYLREFETNFTSAIKANYTRNIPRKDIEKMVDIYNRVNDSNIRICSYCSSSILSFLKDIGKIYYDEVQKGNEPELTDNELQKTVTEMTQCNGGMTELKTKNNTAKNTKRNAKYTTK